MFISQPEQQIQPLATDIYNIIERQEGLLEKNDAFREADDCAQSCSRLFQAIVNNNWGIDYVSSGLSTSFDLCNTMRFLSFCIYTTSEDAMF